MTKKQRLMIVFAANAMSVPLALAAAYILINVSGFSVDVEQRILDILLLLFIFFGLFCGIASLVLKNRLKLIYADQKLTPDKEIALRLITLSLSEAPVIFGFVYSLLKGETIVLLIFAVFSAFLFYLNKPVETYTL